MFTTSLYCIRLSALQLFKNIILCKILLPATNCGYGESLAHCFFFLHIFILNVFEFRLRIFTYFMKNEIQSPLGIISHSL
jgi:hypothetical protein